MLNLSYYRYFVRFSDNYIRDKFSLYVVYKSVKKKFKII